MSYASSAEVLDAIAVRIESLTPNFQLNTDDRFRVTCSPSGEADNQVEGRTTFLSAMGAIPLRPGLGCHPWQTQITIETVYPIATAELGSHTTHQRALRDCEDVLADLQTWATTTDGIVKIDADMADPTPTGDGFLVCTRRIRVDFQRT